MTRDIEMTLAAARYNRETQLGQAVGAAANSVAGLLFGRRARSASTRHTGNNLDGSRT